MPSDAQTSLTLYFLCEQCALASEWYVEHVLLCIAMGTDYDTCSQGAAALFIGE